jgi:hypothetical protein
MISSDYRLKSVYKSTSPQTIIFSVSFFGKNNQKKTLLEKPYYQATWELSMATLP